MVMTNEEIVRDYCQAGNKNKQIKILADLNLVSPSEIRMILAQAGVAGVKAPSRVAPRRNKSKPPDPPAEIEPGVYQRIETVLASLPDGMGEKARWAAGKLAAELFAEYLMQRLELREAGADDKKTT